MNVKNSRILVGEKYFFIFSNKQNTLQFTATVLSPDHTLLNMMEGSSDAKLFTPGPLTCSSSVKEAMLRDLGSRDSQFIQAVSDIRKSLLDIAGVSPEEWTAVLLQGSGTYAVEAVLQTSSPRQGARVLVIANGAYGKRMVQVCEVAGIEGEVIRFAEIFQVDLEEPFRRYGNIRHVWVARNPAGFGFVDFEVIGSGTFRGSEDGKYEFYLRSVTLIFHFFT